MGWISEKDFSYTPPLEQGALYFATGLPAPSTETSYPCRVRSADFLGVPAVSVTVTMNPAVMFVVMRYKADDSYQGYVPSSGWTNGSYTYTHTAGEKIKVTCKKNSAGTTPLSPTDFVCTVSGSVDYQWAQDDGKFLGYPFSPSAGVAQKFGGNETVWRLQSGVFLDYPFIHSAGVARQYGNTGFSRLFYENVKVLKLYYQGVAVKKVWYDGVLVFESG